MTTPATHILFRTTTNLLHPAVLGTIIVSLIQLGLSGDILKNGAFPILASSGLVWYFVLDFWVTMIAFEKDPSLYGVKLFLIDILILVLLFAGFYTLWIRPNDFWFFASLVAQILSILIWNLLSGAGSGLRDRLTQLLILCVLMCAIPLFTSTFAPAFHPATRYVVLLGLACFLVLYTRFTLKE